MMTGFKESVDCCRMEEEFQAAVEQLGGLNVAGPAAVWASLHSQFPWLTKKVLIQIY